MQVAGPANGGSHDDGGCASLGRDTGTVAGRAGANRRPTKASSIRGDLRLEDGRARCRRVAQRHIVDSLRMTSSKGRSRPEGRRN